MKTIKITTTVIIFFAICLLPTLVSAQHKKNLSIVEFNLKVNFKDSKGKALIEKELKKEAGVSKVFVNADTKLVTVNFDGNTTNREKINSAIEKIGFTTEFSIIDKKTNKSCVKDTEKKAEEPK